MPTPRSRPAPRAPWSWSPATTAPGSVAACSPASTSASTRERCSTSPSGRPPSARLPLTVLAFLRKGQDPDESRRRLAEVTAGYGERFPDVHVTCEVRRGRPAHELVLAAAAMNLLVVGRHRPTGVTHSPVGHVRTGVVDRSPCPVAVVPLARS